MTRRSFFPVSLAHQALHWSITGLFIPVISLFQLAGGMNLAQIGINLAVYSGMTIALEIPTGTFADTFGRKRIYSIALFTMISGLSVLLLFRQMIAVTIGFGLLGAGRALSSGTMDALFVDEFQRLLPEKQLDLFFSRVNAAVLISLAGSSLAGGYIPKILGPRMQSFFGDPETQSIYSATFVIMIVMAVILLIFTACIQERSGNDENPAESEPDISEIRSVLRTAGAAMRKNSILVLLLCSSAAWGLSFSGVEAFWQPRLSAVLDGAGTRTELFGYLSMGYFLMGAVGGIISPLVTRMFRGAYAVSMIFLRICMGAVLLLLAGVSQLGAFSAVYLLLFFFNGLSEVPHTSLFHREVSSEIRSTLISVDSVFLQAGGIAGSLLFGFLSEQYSIMFSWRIGAAVLALSAFFYAAVSRKERAAERVHNGK